MDRRKLIAIVYIPVIVLPCTFIAVLIGGYCVIYYVVDKYSSP